MSFPPPPILIAMTTAYRDVAAALAAMPHLALAAFLIVVATAFFDFAVTYRVVPDTSALGRDITGLISNLFLAPVLIAVHRFIILGEVTARYRFDLSDPRLQLFYGWSAAIYVMMAVIGALGGAEGLKFPVAQVFVLALALSFCIVSLRMTILLPAVAVDAPGAALANAIADTKGHFWYIVFVLIVPMLPLVLVAGVLVVFAALAPGPVASVVTLLIVGIAMVLLLALLVALASRLYLSLGARVLQP